MDPRELLSALSDPDAFPDAGPLVDVVQTHASMVFLTGERAYKVKKSVALWGLLDYSTLSKRRFFCEEEIRLNRRAAPDVYLGVEPVVRRGGRLRVGGEGEVVDWAVVMRRLPPGATLKERILAGLVNANEVAEIAQAVARLHAEGVRSPEVSHHGRPVAFARVVRQNFLASRHDVPDLFPASAHEVLASRVARLLRVRRATLERRHRVGLIVEAHGDLRAEHAVRLDTAVGPVWRVIDALEFSPSLRCLDPLSDAAFLAMDLASLGRRDLERAYLDAYLLEAPDADAADLLPLYLAYRAHVRAKVDAHRAGEDEVPAAERARARAGARRHFALAWTYAVRDRPPPLIVLVGPSGTGKSVVARAIAPPLDAEVHSSDPIRKRLAGIRTTDRLEGDALAALYAPDMSRRTYEAMLEGGEATLRAGRAAILDATFLRRSSREAALDLARRLGSPAVLVSVAVPEAVARARIEARTRAGTDASDATFEVYRSQVAEAEGFSDLERPHVLEHDGTADPHDVLPGILDRCAVPLPVAEAGGTG
ncbi:MAG TPA: AAA family ATPase [Planctomycetota bacterium]|nr:AAA family ATPase [Planctomycetota bacterium]